MNGVKKTYKQRWGSERKKISRKNSNPQAIARRKRVIERLELQLLAGTKPRQDATGVYDSLTIGDITRINKEIETLKTRI